jgi:hypothetical protein
VPSLTRVRYRAELEPLGVGGGGVKNGTQHTLSSMPLRWIIRGGFLAQTGISFKVDGLREVGLDPSTLYPDVLLHPEAPLLNERTSIKSGTRTGPCLSSARCNPY